MAIFSDHDDDEVWANVLDQVDEITGRRTDTALSVPYKQECPRNTDAHCRNAESVPDTPPDKPSPALACLTPSAMALLQSGMPQASSPQQHRRLYAPPSLFPGFATQEKLQLQPSASEQLKGHLPAPGPQHAYSQHNHHPLRSIGHERPRCDDSTISYCGPANMEAMPMTGSQGRHIKGKNRYEPHTGAPLRSGTAQPCSSSALQDSQGLDPSHSCPSHEAPRQRLNRRSRDPILYASDASARSRGQALSDTACQGQHIPMKPPAGSITRRSSDVVSEQFSVAAQSSQECCPSSGQPDKRPALPGSLIHAREVLQPSTGQPGHNKPPQEGSSRQPFPWARGKAAVRSPKDITARMQEFRHMLPRLPLPPASQTECPGVFKTAKSGCGAALLPVVESFTLDGGQSRMAYWQCGNRDCRFREFLHERLTKPQLALEAISAEEGFKVMPALGAEQVAAFCGGVSALLTALGVDMRLATIPNPCLHRTGASDEEPDQGLITVSFPWQQYTAVVAALRRRGGPNLDLLGSAGAIPDSALRAVRCLPQRLSEEEVDARMQCIPAPLAKAMLPFQREGVRFGVQHKGRLLLADEMGVGKTVQAIALASCYQDQWPLLVVVPASLRLAWAEELAKWLPHVRPSQVHVIEGRTDRLSGSSIPQVVITSYDMLKRLSCKACLDSAKPGSACAGPDMCMAAKGFKVVIVDESHTLRTGDKAPDSGHTEATVRAVKAAEVAVLLTGTPSLSRPFDLYRQVDALRPGLLGATRDDFARRYCARHKVPVRGREGAHYLKWCNTGLSHGRELHAVLKQEVMLRRLKKEVLGQLPPKRRQVVRLPAPDNSQWPKDFRRSSDEDANDTDEEERDCGDECDRESEEDGTEQAEDNRPMGLSRATALAKLPSVSEWLRHALGSASRGAPSSDSGADAAPKFLIFAHHKDVMRKLAQELEGTGQAEWAGVGYVQIDGSTDQRDRRDACQRFKNDPCIRVALLSVMAAGVGLEFTAASGVVFVELPDEVSILLQAEDRAHRHGQLMAVNIYYLLARGTSDERKWQRLNRSLERVSAVHDGGEDARSGAAADSSHTRGIAVHAVKTVSADQGWACTQHLPEQAPDAHSAQEAALQLQDGQQSACLPRKNLTRQPADTAKERGSAAPQQRAAGQPESQTGSHGLSLELLGTEQPQAELTSAASVIEVAAQDLEASMPSKPPAEAPEVYFEMGLHTNRVHFHGKEDGSRLLGLSLPLDLLTAPLTGGAPACIQDLILHLRKRDEEKVHFEQVGLLALPGWVTAPVLEQWLQEACEFAAEWAELRPLHQNRLCGRCLRAPLQAYVEEVEALARAEGAYGIGTDRHLEGSGPLLPAPPGTELATVDVKYHGRANLFQYKQAFTDNGQRLCLKCMKEVPGCTVAQATLQGAALLFCSPKCEGEYIMAAGGSALRRLLRDLERGVCQICKLDCLHVVKRLRLVEKGSKGWRQKREKKLRELAPKFCAHGYKPIMERLVNRTLEGNAWHADHVIPVYKGGGMCQLDNLRTLCVPCHQDVTKAQAKERANARNLQNQHTLDRYIVPGSPSAASPSLSTAGAAKPRAKPRKQLKRLYTDAPAVGDPDFQ